MFSTFSCRSLPASLPLAAALNAQLSSASISQEVLPPVYCIHNPTTTPTRLHLASLKYMEENVNKCFQLTGQLHENPFILADTAPRG